MPYIDFDGYKIGYTTYSDYTPYMYILKKAREGVKVLQISKAYLDLLYDGDSNIAFRIEDKKRINGMEIQINEF